MPTLRKALALLLVAFTVSAHADEVQGFRFQIATADDSAVTRRIVDDLYKRLGPTFAVFRTELAQRRRMLISAIGHPTPQHVTRAA